MERLCKTLMHLFVLVLRGAARIWYLDRMLFLLLLLALVVGPVVWVWSPVLGVLYGLLWILLVMVALVAREVGLEDLVARLITPRPSETRCSTVLLKAISNEVCQAENDRTLARATGTKAEHPVSDLSRESLTNLERVLRKLKGQDTAIALVTRSLRRRSVGVSDRSKPLSFLFVGPTGVGKTELAKLTATGLGRSLERFDIGQLGKEGGDSNAHGSGWTLFGSPQGFVGGEGKLTSAVAGNPSAIILLDEIEKGSPELLDLFLAILDEGSAKDNRTNEVVDFSNCILFFTSNLITTIPSEVQADPSLARDLVLEMGFFKTEMINRFSYVVPMKHLEIEVRRAIAIDSVGSFLTHAVGPDSHKVVDRAVIEIILRKSDTKYGARDLQRVIEQLVGDPLADALIARGESYPVTELKIVVNNGTIEVEVR